MAALTLYQLQGKRRIKRALKRRYSADFKARGLALRLATALGDATVAATNVATINTLYGTTYAGSTSFIQALNTAGVGTAITAAAAASVAGAPAQLYAPLPNANGGAELAPNAALD